MFERTRRPARPTRRTTARPGDHDEPTTTPSTSSGPLPASVFEGGREEQRSRGRGRTSEADSASLSPWTGIGSPSSSDFEAISDSEVRQVDFSSSSAAPPSTRMREDSSSSSFTTSSSSFSRGRRSSSAREGDDSDANRRGIEGDDEDSSAFEDAGGYGGGYGEDERGRGRGRTRRREPGPEMRRSMLEDALRSSLATLLSLAPGQPSAMSQTPSMSHASLAALWSPTASTSSAPPAAAPRPSMQRVSPFASALEDDEEEEEDDLEHLDRPTISSGEDVFLSSSSSSSSDEDGTQLAPSSSTRSHAAPLPINITSASQSRSRTRSYSHPESTFPAPSSSSGFTSTFSPLHPSRPLGAPSSNSPPTFSRSRRGGGERWSGGIRKRGRGGRGGSTSPAPAPASVEERRRARAEAAAAWGSASASAVPAAGGGRGGMRGYEERERERERRGTGTDVEEGAVERDEAFAELLSAARFFSDLSPRSSRTSLPSFYTSTASPSSATQPLPSSTRSALDDAHEQDDEGEEEEEQEEDDPALASESVPTLEGLSSGDSRGSGGRSRSLSSVDAEKAAAGGETEKEKKVEEKEKEEEKGKEKKRGGILGWLRGLGSAVVELKVWHLVGICGLLIGVGLGAGSLISSLASSTPLLSFLHLTPSSPLTPATAGSLIKVPPRIARFGSSAPRGEEGGMSALFC